MPWTDPRLLYRGVAINAASMAPINGIQFGVNQYLEEMCAEHGGSPKPWLGKEALGPERGAVDGAEGLHVSNTIASAIETFEIACCTGCLVGTVN